jgi:hypothetical protein
MSLELTEPDLLKRAVVLSTTPRFVTSPYSQAGVCSNHWLPQDVALAFTGSTELRTLAKGIGFRPMPVGGVITIAPGK